ncbi:MULTISPECIES: hypothetical protein [Flavobacterium]|uniref:Uncharacterized protein n=1 Tax=Flavobacterium humidisoli TaxID=2937442 RepID=A0ABY4LMT1_9FLAO|nr:MULTISPECIES: hypothetical protein [Flavobacterium]TDX11707.1 hypothetical protein EDB96_2499 [Flavobacterium sp. S87F.05.LMB.W.Kidney.N]UPZ13938.1 hypothetical protein M0M44_14380 [Flavobacterium humidisoli]
MKKPLLLSSLLLLISCQKSESNDGSKEEPSALQEKSIDIGRFKSRNDLVDDLYQELVNKSPELKTLEDELNEINPRDTTEIFNNYDDKSYSYYGSAKGNTEGIRDSILKKKILNLISKSSDRYDSKKAEIESLVTTINKKRTEITNYHTALKIVLTLPLIEKYQNDHLPKKSPFEKVIEKENQLLEKVKENTPKY